MSWAERLVLVREKRNASRIPVRKHEGKRPLRRPTLKLKYDIKGILKSWERIGI
jgi:hypothetical protein